MGVLAPLVSQAQPALFGGGCTGAGTDGASWLWKFTGVVDTAGTAINLSGVTGTCIITSGIGGGTIATLTFTGASDGTFTLGLDESDTAGLAAGATSQPQRYRWHFTLSDGTDVVQVWGPTNSQFLIYAGV